MVTVNSLLFAIFSLAAREKKKKRRRRGEKWVSSSSCFPIVIVVLFVLLLAGSSFSPHSTRVLILLPWQIVFTSKELRLACVKPAYRKQERCHCCITGFLISCWCSHYCAEAWSTLCRLLAPSNQRTQQSSIIRAIALLHIICGLALMFNSKDHMYPCSDCAACVQGVGTRRNK